MPEKAVIVLGWSCLFFIGGYGLYLGLLLNKRFDQFEAKLELRANELCDKMDKLAAKNKSKSKMKKAQGALEMSSQLHSQQQLAINQLTPAKKGPTQDV